MDQHDQPIIEGAGPPSDPQDLTMRYSADHREKTRKKIVDTAGRAFRERGFDGIGVDGLMRSAELTSGAFYGHFDSKNEIFREVVGVGLGRLRARILHYQETVPEAWVEAMVDFYFGAAHVQNVSGGCALPSLSPDVARADDATRDVYADALAEIADVIAAAPPFSDRTDALQRAWSLLAILAGGVMLARAVPDDAVASQILAGTRRAALATVD
jgi:TetR/AcrR family transcriptional regulator, transcriptional repressor for nem operon